MAYQQNQQNDANYARVVGGLSPGVGMVAQAFANDAKTHPNGFIAKAINKWTKQNKAPQPAPVNRAPLNRAPVVAARAPGVAARAPQQTSCNGSCPLTSPAYNRPVNQPSPANQTYNRPVFQAPVQTGGCAARQAQSQAGYRAPQQSGCGLRAAVAAQNNELGYQAGSQANAVQKAWNLRQESLYRSGSACSALKSSNSDDNMAGIKSGPHPAPFHGCPYNNSAQWAPQQYQAPVPASSCGGGSYAAQLQNLARNPYAASY